MNKVNFTPGDYSKLPQSASATPKNTPAAIGGHSIASSSSSASKKRASQIFDNLNGKKTKNSNNNLQSRTFVEKTEIKAKEEKKVSAAPAVDSHGDEVPPEVLPASISLNPKTMNVFEELSKAINENNLQVFRGLLNFSEKLSKEDATTLINQVVDQGKSEFFKLFLIKPLCDKVQDCSVLLLKLLRSKNPELSCKLALEFLESCSSKLSHVEIGVILSLLDKEKHNAIYDKLINLPAYQENIQYQEHRKQYFPQTSYFQERGRRYQSQYFQRTSFQQNFGFDSTSNSYASSSSSSSTQRASQVFSEFNGKKAESRTFVEKTETKVKEEEDDTSKSSDNCNTAASEVDSQVDGVPLEALLPNLSLNPETMNLFDELDNAIKENKLPVFKALLNFSEKLSKEDATRLVRQVVFSVRSDFFKLILTNKNFKDCNWKSVISYIITLENEVLLYDPKRKVLLQNFIGSELFSTIKDSFKTHWRKLVRIAEAQSFKSLKDLLSIPECVEEIDSERLAYIFRLSARLDPDLFKLFLVQPLCDKVHDWFLGDAFTQLFSKDSLSNYQLALHFLEVCPSKLTIYNILVSLNYLNNRVAWKPIYDKLISLPAYQDHIRFQDSRKRFHQAYQQQQYQYQQQYQQQYYQQMPNAEEMKPAPQIDPKAELERIFGCTNLTKENCERKYRKWASTNHPDKAKNAEDRAIKTKLFQDVGNLKEKFLPK